jgi:NAD+ synthase (glutamine-hydrolysing)
MSALPDRLSPLGPLMTLEGFVRVTVASPPVTVAGPRANRLAIERLIRQLPDSQVLVLPELCLSGYTCGELFTQRSLLEASMEELLRLVEYCQSPDQLVLVGLPLIVDQALYNVAAAISAGRLLGLVPKQYLPTYQEFYERRWFQPGGPQLPAQIQLADGQSVPLGCDLLFQAGDLVVGVEICEDLWVPIPPSSYQALAGANLLVNLSASNETIGKADYRRQLVLGQSGRCVAAYAYASAGPGESTTDVLFGGHSMICESGRLLAELPPIGCERPGGPSDGDSVTTDIDLHRLEHDRRLLGTFHDTRWLLSPPPCAPNGWRRIVWGRADGRTSAAVTGRLMRPLTGQPFVPRESSRLAQRCGDILEIQSAALAKRVSQLPEALPLVIGVSGGLDSTLALLVAARTAHRWKWPQGKLRGVILPGFGTSQGTLASGRRLLQLVGVPEQSIDIRALALDTFRALGHSPLGVSLEDHDAESFTRQVQQLPDDQLADLVFENVQARLRTLLLMSQGFVLGTGDLSEAALGWSTYNADHMSMYNVNCSIPKTLVRWLIGHVAQHESSDPLREVLEGIMQTPISPELLPLGSDGQIRQATEDQLGPYELHDFFLYHMVRTGAGPRRLWHLAQQAAFSRPYAAEEIVRGLEVFIDRFFASQFKRTCVPDGPKVGSVSLSPRGDWRMPTDADVGLWGAEVAVIRRELEQQP